MKKNLALFLVLIATSALSADWYIMPHVGFSYLQNTDEKLQIPLGNAGSSSRLKARATFEPGYLAGVGVGCQCGYYSLELDYNHVYNDLYRISTDLDPTDNQQFYLYRGYMQADILLVGGFYTLRKHCQLTPYIGAGVGVANLQTEQILASPFFDGTTVDDNIIRFTYHFRVGLKYCLTQCVTTDLYYSYFDVVKPKFQDIFHNSFRLNYRLHTVNFGLGYSF